MIMYLLKLVISIFAKNVVDTYGDCIRRMYGDGMKQIKNGFLLGVKSFTALRS